MVLMSAVTPAPEEGSNPAMESTTGGVADIEEQSKPTSSKRLAGGNGMASTPCRGGLDLERAIYLAQGSLNRIKQHRSPVHRVNQGQLGDGVDPAAIAVHSVDVVDMGSQQRSPLPNHEEWPTLVQGSHHLGRRRQALWDRFACQADFGAVCLGVIPAHAARHGPQAHY